MPPVCSLASAKLSLQAITYTSGTPLACSSRTRKHSYPSYVTHTRACIYCPSFPHSHVTMAHTLFKQCALQSRLFLYRTPHVSYLLYPSRNTNPRTLLSTTHWAISRTAVVNNSTSAFRNPPARKLPAQYVSQQKPEELLVHSLQMSLNELNIHGKTYQSTCLAKCAYKAYPMYTTTYHSCVTTLERKW